MHHPDAVAVKIAACLLETPCPCTARTNWRCAKTPSHDRHELALHGPSPCAVLLKCRQSHVLSMAVEGLCA